MPSAWLRFVETIASTFFLPATTSPAPSTTCTSFPITFHRRASASICPELPFPQVANSSYLSTRDGSACCLFQSSFHPPSPDFLRSSVRAGAATFYALEFLGTSAPKRLFFNFKFPCWLHLDVALQLLPVRMLGAAATPRGGACPSCCRRWAHFIMHFEMMNRLKLARII